MKRSEEELLLYSLLGYLGASLLATVLLLLFSLASMKLFFSAMRFALGADRVYWLKPAAYDSLGFALSAAGTAVLQYFLSGFLRLAAGDRAFISMVIAFTALFCGLVFWRSAVNSPLGAYPFSGLCVTIAALIGGLASVFQPDSGNPFPRSLFRQK